MNILFWTSHRTWHHTVNNITINWKKKVKYVWFEFEITSYHDQPLSAFMFRDAISVVVASQRCNVEGCRKTLTVVIRWTAI